jgi:hypothetical protein
LPLAWIISVAFHPAAVFGQCEDRSIVKVTAKRSDTKIKTVGSEGKLVLDITSDFGIDKATVERAAAKWPKAVFVHLHLKGLESFKATSGDVTVQWSVSSDGDSRITLWEGTKETEVNEGSTYYAKPRVVGADHGVLPPEGYFEVPIPAKLLEKNPNELRLEWIDFYRG